MDEHVGATKSTELPTNNDCWAIAKKVWPELSDSDPVLVRAKFTNMVADVAWNGHYDYRLRRNKGEAEAIEGLLREWRGRD